MVDEISNALTLDFNQKVAYKFSAKWNTGYKMLIINTGKKEE